jgi:hypothetical protein
MIEFKSASVMAQPMGGVSRGNVVMVVTALMLIISTLFVLLRMISRIGIVRRLAWDDYFMMIAWVSSNTP